MMFNVTQKHIDKAGKKPYNNPLVLALKDLFPNTARIYTSIDDIFILSTNGSITIPMDKEMKKLLDLVKKNKHIDPSIFSCKMSLRQIYGKVLF